MVELDRRTVLAMLAGGASGLAGCTSGGSEGGAAPVYPPPTDDSDDGDTDDSGDGDQPTDYNRLNMNVSDLSNVSIVDGSGTGLDLTISIGGDIVGGGFYNGPVTYVTVVATDGTSERLELDSGDSFGLPALPYLEAVDRLEVRLPTSESSTAWGFLVV